MSIMSKMLQRTELYQSINQSINQLKHICIAPYVSNESETHTPKVQVESSNAAYNQCSSAASACCITSVGQWSILQGPNLQNFVKCTKGMLRESYEWFRKRFVNYS